MHGCTQDSTHNTTPWLHACRGPHGDTLCTQLRASLQAGLHALQHTPTHMHTPPVQPSNAALPAGIECPRGARNLPGMVQEGEPFSEEATQFTKELVLQREVGTAPCMHAGLQCCIGGGEGEGDGRGGCLLWFCCIGFGGGGGMRSSCRGGCGGCKRGGCCKEGGAAEGVALRVEEGCIEGGGGLHGRRGTGVALKDAEQAQGGCIKGAQWLHEGMHTADAEWLH